MAEITSVHGTWCHMVYIVIDYFSPANVPHQNGPTRFILITTNDLHQEFKNYM